MRRWLLLLIYFYSKFLLGAEFIDRRVALDVWPERLPNADSLSQGCHKFLPALTAAEWLHNPNSSQIAFRSFGIKASYHIATIKGFPGEKVVISSSLPLVDKGFACLTSDQGQQFLVFDSQKERRGYPSFGGAIGQNGELKVEALLLAQRPVSPLILTRTYAADVEDYASIFYWILIGGLTAVLLYNSFLWLGAKKALYKINVIYITAILCLNFVFSFGFFAARNLWIQLGWGDAEILVRVLNALGNPSGLLASTCVIYFSIYYCDIAALSQRLFRGLRLAFHFGIMLSLIGFLYIFITNDPGKMNSISRYLGSINSLIILGTAAYAGFWRKMIFGRILFFSYLPLTVGTSIFVSYLEGRISGDNIFTRNSLLIGSFFESLILSYSVGFRFRLTEDLARSKTEELSAKLLRVNEELEEKVELATGEIRAMLQNIAEAVFIVDLTPDGYIKLSEQMSDHTWNLFPNLRSGLKPDFETFLNSLDLSQERKTGIRSLIITSIGEDLLAFQLNEGLVPREVHGLAGQVMEMTIDPILNSERKIQRLLITIKDISDRREHEKNRKKEEEYNHILLELVKSGLTRVENHLFILEKTLGQEGQDEQSKEQCLRQLHTAKGVARSWGFQLFSERIHEVEEAVIKDKIEIKDARRYAAEIYGKYQDIYQTRLMRGHDDEQIDQERRLQAVKAALANLRAPASEEFRNQVLEILSAAMCGGEFMSEIVLRFQSEVDRLSDQMGRAPCRFEVIHDQVVKLSRELSVTLIGILGHLIRNSLDHGMESASERQQMGKNPRGTLYLEVLENSSEKLSFRFWDDGRGLDLLAVQNKALANGIENVSESEALDLIFQNQFSSREKANVISGRGLGLDAVCQQAESTGGQARALLNLDAGSGSRFLVLHIELGLKEKTAAA